MRADGRCSSARPACRSRSRSAASFADIPHQVLNARNEEAEAAIVARAGERGAVTISTNMAGRGVDIRLGPGVAELGGLHVVGTTRYESRRIDHQLRGRAGRQGDPGSSRFFVSNEDALMVKFGGECASPDQAQRIAEGQNLGMRLLLRKYETIVEAQRQLVAERRQRVLTGDAPELERRVMLQTIDDLWADYLAAVADLRADAVWISLGAANPFANYIRPGPRHVQGTRADDRRRMAGAPEAGHDGRRHPAPARRDVDVSDDRRTVRPPHRTHHARPEADDPSGLSHRARTAASRHTMLGSNGKLTRILHM